MPNYRITLTCYKSSRLDQLPAEIYDETTGAHYATGSCTPAEMSAFRHPYCGCRFEVYGVQVGDLPIEVAARLAPWAPQGMTVLLNDSEPQGGTRWKIYPGLAVVHPLLHNGAVAFEAEDDHGVTRYREHWILVDAVRVA